MLITAEQIKKISPRASLVEAGKYLEFLNPAMDQAEIDTTLRRAAFISQLLHESGSFKYKEEIASGRAYEGRRDLGNVHKGDGVKFKGRGPIQITGRANYSKLSLDLFQDLRLLDTPELVAGYEVGSLAAVWYWTTRKLNTWADKPASWRVEIREGVFYDRVQYITLKINGGQNGLQERRMYYDRALKIL